MGKYKCADCDNFMQCEYYHSRKGTSQICAQFDNSFETIPKAEVRKMLRDCADKVSDSVLDIVKKEYIPKDQYEARLKADLEAMLEELSVSIDEIIHDGVATDEYLEGYDDGCNECQGLIQEKINALRGEENENNNL